MRKLAAFWVFVSFAHAAGATPAYAKPKKKRPSIVIPDETAEKEGGIIGGSAAPDAAASVSAPADPATAAPIPAPPPAKPNRPTKETTREAAPPPNADLDALRAEYEALRDALFRSRTRAQAVEDATSPTRLAGKLRWKAPKGYTARRVQLSLDGASLWDSGDGAMGEDVVTVAERGVAAGRHVVAVRWEVRAGTESKQGYSGAHEFVLDLPEGRRTEVEIVVDEDGDTPEYEPVITLIPKTKK